MKLNTDSAASSLLAIDTYKLYYKIPPIAIMRLYLVCMQGKHTATFVDNKKWLGQYKPLTYLQTFSSTHCSHRDSLQQMPQSVLATAQTIIKHGAP